MAHPPFPAALAAAALLALTGCERVSVSAPDVEAAVPAPTFGLAVRNNEVVSRGGAPLVSLQGRFAAEVPSMVTFPFDSAALEPAARAALDRQAGWMRQFPELGFRVYGFADVIGPGPYNERLGRARARAVVAYLASRGVSPARLEALVSFGERYPLVPNAGRERLNRRVITQVSGFVARHPTVLNGKYAEIVFREYVASAVPLTVVETGAEGIVE